MGNVFKTHVEDESFYPECDCTEKSVGTVGIPWKTVTTGDVQSEWKEPDTENTDENVNREECTENVMFTFHDVLFKFVFKMNDSVIEAVLFGLRTENVEKWVTQRANDLFDFRGKRFSFEVAHVQSIGSEG